MSVRNSPLEQDSYQHVESLWFIHKCPAIIPQKTCTFLALSISR